MKRRLASQFTSARGVHPGVNRGRVDLAWLRANALYSREGCVERARSLLADVVRTGGWLVFYTDRDSPKGRELDAHARASLIFYWEPLQRQVRVRGPVVRSPEAESDAYFSSRPLGAQVSARASEQSRPVSSRAELQERHAREAALGAAPRPERWGGYRVWIESLEFWVGMPDRLHDRALYSRQLEATPEGFAAGDWSATRLQP